MDAGTCVWFCDIREIASLQSQEWDAYLSILSPIEQERVLKYRYDDDRRRALISALSQRWLVRNKLGVDDDESFEILRTPENKPYANVSHRNVSYPLGFWNFNLSHHGSFVGLASHANRLIGVDIVDLTTRTTLANNAHAYAKLFKSQLHADELKAVLAQPSEQAAYTLFFVIWSLKESFIKAIGLGMGYDLKKICFTVYYHLEGGPPLSPVHILDPLSQSQNRWADRGNGDSDGDSSTGTDTDSVVGESISGYATARIDGEERVAFRGGAYRPAVVPPMSQSGVGVGGIPTHPIPPGSVDLWPEPSHSGLWSFDFFSLDGRHVVSVATGPLADCIPSYRRLAWGVSTIPVDSIPRVTRRAPELPASNPSSLPSVSSRDGWTSTAEMRPQQGTKPPSPNCVEDIQYLSKENAAQLDDGNDESIAEAMTATQTVATVFPTPTPKGCRVSLRSLLPPSRIRSMPSALPVSPPATELNNRYDTSVLVDEYQNQAQNHAAGVCVDTKRPSLNNYVDGGACVEGYDSPLSPGVAHQRDKKTPSLLQRTLPTMDASQTDWKQLHLPGRNTRGQLSGASSQALLGGELDDFHDFHSPADWRVPGVSRSRAYTPTAEEVNKMLRDADVAAAAKRANGQSGLMFESTQLSTINHCGDTSNDDDDDDRNNKSYSQSMVLPSLVTPSTEAQTQCTGICALM